MESRSEVYSLFELTELDDVFTPVRNTARVKYTCFDVCDRFLIFGANSGSLYIFQRKPLQFLRVLSNKEGPLIIIRISPNDRYVAFATSKGVVVLLEPNISAGQVGRSNVSSVPPRYLNVSSEHLGTVVTCLHWSDSSNRLFVANANGKVTSVNVASKKAQTLFKVSTSMIVQLDSRVVQMDFAREKLLVSTLTSCFLCDTTKEQYSQVGTKPRDGEFGACFYNSLHTQTPTIYAARPGSRLWEVDFEGCVLCTHQFKKALANASLYVIPISNDFAALNAQLDSNLKSCNFPKLIVVRERFLLTWVKERLVLFNPASMGILLWTSFSCEILDVRACDEELYVWGGDGKFRDFHLWPVDRGIHRLLSEEDNRRWKLGATLCRLYEDLVVRAQSRKWLPRRLLVELAARLRRCEETEASERVEELVGKLEEPPSADLPLKYRIESGIYVVHRPNGVLSKANPNVTNGGEQSGGRDAWDGGFNATTGGGRDGVIRLDSLETTAANAGQLPGAEPQCSRDSSAVKTVNGLTHAPLLPAMKKTASVADMQPTGEERNRLLKRGHSLNEVYCYQPVHGLMPFAGAYFWDLDQTYGYEALASINPGAALDVLKHSLSSKYQSGKERILSKIGVLEDHLKSMTVEDPLELLDVQVGCRRSPDWESPDAAGNYVGVTNSAGCIKGGAEGTAAGCEETRAPLVPDLDLSALLRASRWTRKCLRDPDVVSDKNRRLALMESWVNVLADTQESMYRKYHRGRKQPSKSDERNRPWRRSNSCDALRPDCVSIESESHPTGVAREVPPHQRRRSCPESPRPGDEDRTVGAMRTMNEPGCHTTLDDRKIPLSLEEVFWWQDFEATVGEERCLLCRPRIFVHDPWGLNADDRELVAELAALCFESKTFGRITSYATQVAGLVRIESLDISETLPGGRLNGSDAVDCVDGDNALDHARSIFVRQFFHLLRPAEIFRELRRDEASTFLTWRTIVRGVMEIVPGDGTVGPDASSLELNIFNSLLSSIRRPMQDAFQMAQNLCRLGFSSPRDVLYVSRLISTDESGLFLAYMDLAYERERVSTRCRSRTTSPVNFQGYEFDPVDACKDSIVQVAWLTAMLRDSIAPPFEEVKCECGMPRAWSHLYPWKRKDLMLNVLALNSGTRERCLELCKEFGFWAGYLQLCHAVVSRREAFRVFVQLGDIELLKDPFSIAILPQTVDEWTTFLRFMVVQRQTAHVQCLFCGCRLLAYPSQDKFAVRPNTLSFEGVAHFLLKLCSADVVLKLMAEVVDALPQVRLSSTFYHHCVSNAILRQQRTSARSMSDSTAACVWSQHRNYASPQIRANLLSEINRTASETVPAQTIDRFPGNLECQWGVTLDPSSPCASCAIPLVVQLTSSNQGGVRIFPCGHGFHLQCTERGPCPVCR